MTKTRTYPEGVPSWVDLEAPDLDAAQRFYERLFGWRIEAAAPDGSYLIATLDGRDVAGLAPGEASPARWATYIAVEDADAAAARIGAAGGTILEGPLEVGAAGRRAECRDSVGAEFAIWQAGRRPGAQLVNAPGAWNFSNLHAPDVQAALAFYAEVFGWEAGSLDIGEPEAATLWRRPGYGDHLERTVDPGIRERQQGAPAGFEDGIAWLERLGEGERAAAWQVSFSVADRDASMATAERLGATVLSREDSLWTRTAVIRDPQGARLTLSQFTPPEGF